MSFRMVFLGLVIPALLLTLGCSSPSDDPWAAQRPKTYPVEGVVFYQGKPVEGATVVFNSPKENRAAYGVTDNAGLFSLTTFETGDGAVAGPQEVRISKIKTEQTTTDPELAVAPPKEINLLPAKYADFKTSGLTAEVKSDAENRVEFRLAD